MDPGPLPREDRFEWQRLVIVSQLMRTRARPLSTMVALALALAGCQGLFPPPIDIDRPVIPLSKVYVRNATDAGHHVRMNWRDGFVQVSWIEAGTTQGLTGAIGTSGFPATIDVLTEECELVASLVGLPPGSAGIVVIDADRATLHRLDRADASWTVSDSTEACGASPMDLPSLAPSAEASPQAIHVNEANGWSIVVPPGWEVAANSVGDTALSREGAIAEILVFPASGLKLQQLQAQRVGELSAWPGVEAVEGQIVRLPAGEAVRTSLVTTSPNVEPIVFVSYAIEQGERQYVISVRGPQDDRELLQEAEALAESFAITADGRN